MNTNHGSQCQHLIITANEKDSIIEFEQLLLLSGLHPVLQAIFCSHFLSFYSSFDIFPSALPFAHEINPVHGEFFLCVLFFIKHSLVLLAHRWIYDWVLKWNEN